MRILNQFLASIAIAIQSNPDISSLIVGGLKLIVDVIISLLRRASWVVANYRSMAVACGKLCDLFQEIDGYDRRAFWLLGYFTGNGGREGGKERELEWEQRNDRAGEELLGD